MGRGRDCLRVEQHNGTSDGLFKCSCSVSTPGFRPGEIFDKLLSGCRRAIRRMPDIVVVGRDAPGAHDHWRRPSSVCGRVRLTTALSAICREARVRTRWFLSTWRSRCVPADMSSSTFAWTPTDRYQLVEPDAPGTLPHLEVLPGFWIDPAWFRQDPLPDINRLLLQIAPSAYRRYSARLLAELPAEQNTPAHRLQPRPVTRGGEDDGSIDAAAAASSAARMGCR